MRHTFVVLFIFLFLFAGLSFAQDSENPAELIPELARQLNLWRLSEGLEVLVYNETLESMAVSQADYLQSLGTLPSDLHAGRRGEDARARSQFDEFAWSTYGHPEVFFVTEIIAIGNIETALDFWRGSDIHNRSVTNSQYREVGFAAQQRGDDVMFVVVLGAQPDVVPALVDVEAELVYLTSERGTATGDWIAAPTRYRFLDLNYQPLSDWESWESLADLPEFESDSDSFYIEYEDEAEYRVTYELLLTPIWGTDVPPTTTSMSGEAEATEAAPVGFPTNTPIPTITPTPPPTATPLPRGLQLIYDEDRFTVINNSAVYLNLYNLNFRQGDKRYDGRTWETVTDNLNIGALPPQQCLQIAGFEDTEGIVTLAECLVVRSFVTISEEEFFWVEGEFEVFLRNDSVATCIASEKSCIVLFP